MSPLNFVNYEIFTTSVVGTFTALYIYVAQRLLRRSIESRKLRKTEMRNALSAGLVGGRLENVSDVVNIYKGVYGLGGEDLTFRSDLAKVLREYLVDLTLDSEKDSNIILKTKEKVTAILNQIEVESPFADLPAAERNLILDLRKLIDLGDKISADTKLHDLAGLIEVRQDSLERVQASNKWSIPLALIGLVLTVIFGAISVIK